jgi:beta-phosphoglucomutase-like phosphatase (HAD superfamily)
VRSAPDVISQSPISTPLTPSPAAYLPFGRADRRTWGIIFDFNGVLLWDRAWHEAAWRQFAGQLGRALTDDDLARRVHGRTNADIFTFLLGHRPPDDELAALSEAKEHIYRGLCLAAGDAFKLSRGASSYLDFLAERNMPRAIATSSGRANVEFYIQHLDLLRWFEREYIIFDEGRYPGKPAPDIYLDAAARLGLPPRNCIVVEDSPSGIAAAHAAGIGTIVALGDKELRHLEGVSSVVPDILTMHR